MERKAESERGEAEADMMIRYVVQAWKYLDSWAVHGGKLAT